MLDDLKKRYAQAKLELAAATAAAIQDDTDEVWERRWALRQKWSEARRALDTAEREAHWRPLQ
jgi:hypothetical protein